MAKLPETLELHFAQKTERMVADDGSKDVILYQPYECQIPPAIEEMRAACAERGMAYREALTKHCTLVRAPPGDPKLDAEPELNPPLVVAQVSFVP